MDRYTWFILGGMTIVILSGFFLIDYYLEQKSLSCTSNPLVYGAKQLTQAYGYEFVGSGFFLLPSNYKQVTINFNSTSLSIQK